MKTMSRVSAAVMAFALVSSNAAAQKSETPASAPPVPVVVPPVAPAPVMAVPATAPGKKGPSLYLQCDGNPNNMSAGESVARLIGAITLLALFAPSPEYPNPGARLFGKAGVDACTKLVEGDRREGTLVRRLPLILARALHQIEAADYQAAIADVNLARSEAKAGNLLDDPYFDRSLGVSFDLIEAEARFGADDIAGARRVLFARGERQIYSYYVLIGINGYPEALRPVEPRQVAICQHLAAIARDRFGTCFGLLEEQQKFGEAASYLRDFMQTYTLDRTTPDDLVVLYPRLAIAEALAGEWDHAQADAAKGRELIDKLLDEGKEPALRVSLLEQLDFHDLLQVMHQGRMADARRAFLGRSDWVSLAFAEKTAAVALLRTGAAPADLTGLLASTPDELWKQRRDRLRTARLARYKDNAFLWQRIFPYASAAKYEALSKKTWNVDKSSFFSKNADFTKPAAIYVNGEALTQTDAIMLHSALMAKARGFKGFRLSMSAKSPTTGVVTFTNPGAGPASFYFDADAVIAELRDVIPTPDEATRRQAARGK